MKQSIYLLGTIFLLLQLMDITTTKMGLGISGLYELNPFISYFGFEGKLLVSFLLVSYCIAISQFEMFKLAGYWILIAINLLALFVISNNLVLILMT